MASLFTAATGVVTALAVIFAAFVMRSDSTYPSNLVAEMMTNRKGKEVPVSKMTIIVTGSTNGLGKMIASHLYSLGATVILASRNVSKYESTILEIRSKYPGSIGKLEFGHLDTSDFDSVSSFVGIFLNSHSELHAIVNNAGIHYLSTEGDPINNLSLPMKSKQGYDLAFATNYLGHFLLTEMLLPILSKTSNFGTIVNVASSYHFLGDGKMLAPQPDRQGMESMPIASRSDINDKYSHRELAYGNNKLAQVLHAKELQRRISASNSNVRVVSVCPGWVNTGILPNNIGGKVVGLLAFRVEEGILSTLFGLFDSSLQGGEFLGNSENFWAKQRFLISFATTYGLKGPLCSALAAWLLLFQKFSYGKMHVEPSSPDSLNDDLAKSLYDWSKDVTSVYVK